MLNKFCIRTAQTNNSLGANHGHRNGIGSEYFISEFDNVFGPLRNLRYHIYSLINDAVGQ